MHAVLLSNFMRLFAKTVAKFSWKRKPFPQKFRETKFREISRKWANFRFNSKMITVEQGNLINKNMLPVLQNNMKDSLLML
jgi:hypothetical protein